MKHATAPSHSRAHLQVFLMLLALTALFTSSANAQTLLADNRVPLTNTQPAAVPATVQPSAKAPVDELPAAPSAEMQASLSVNPFSNAGAAALSPDTPAGQTGNSLTSNPTPAKSGHHVVALVGGIAGTVVASFGTVMLVGGSGCRNVCTAQHIGEVTLPLGAAAAVIGYYFAFHHAH